MKIGKLKLKFFMKSGNIIVIKCKSFEISKLSGTQGKRELEIKSADRQWTIDLDNVEGVTATWSLF